MSSVSSVAYPHCVNRYLERRLGFPAHIANQLRRNPHVSKRICSMIKYEVNNEGLYFADIPKNSRRAILSRDWVYIVEDKTVITILWRIPGDLFGSINGAYTTYRPAVDTHHERAKIFGHLSWKKMVQSCEKKRA